MDNIQAMFVLAMLTVPVFCLTQLDDGDRTRSLTLEASRLTICISVGVFITIDHLSLRANPFAQSSRQVNGIQTSEIFSNFGFQASR